MGIEIQLDRASVANFQKQMDYLKKDGKRSLFSSLVKLSQRIRSTAMLRLQSQNHVVTSRLKNSIFVKTSGQNQPIVNKAVGQNMRYQDKDGKVFDADMKSVHLFEDEIAVGTSVEYATKIEVMDSFIYWAVKNFDMSKTMEQLMKEEMAKRPEGGRVK